MLRTLTLLVLFMSNVASAGIIFSEDFESGLSFGVGENWSSNRSGVIVNDPLDIDRALSFRALVGGGDLSSNNIFSTTGKFYVSVDYLGTCDNNNCGGFFWNSISNWVGTTAPYLDLLVDNGTWTTYMVELTGNVMSISFEDWSGSAGIAGDAFFDNILISDTSFAERAPVPEPATLGLFGLSVLGMALRRKLKK